MGARLGASLAGLALLLAAGCGGATEDVTAARPLADGADLEATTSVPESDVATTGAPTTATTALPTTTVPPTLAPTTITVPPPPPPPPTTATTAPPPPPPPPATEPPRAVGGGCHPSYTPCVPFDSDVDCAGGSGNGPSYTGRVEVTGPDEYDLDRDGDGVGCE